jgi:DNA-directed RNA polymerase subunit H (RpoH/RPB5)
MQNNSSTIISLYNSRRILLQQLEKQGFNVENYAHFGINEINILFQNSALDMMLEKYPDTDHDERNKVYIRYFMGKSFRPINIRELVDDLLLNDTITKSDTIIFITNEDGNDTIREFVKQIWEEENIFVILLSLKRLQFDVLKHVLVPPHSIINKSELDEVTAKYKLKTSKLLPEISRFDPVAASIGMRPGDVCKIIRPSKTSIHSVYYRICVNN